MNVYTPVKVREHIHPSQSAFCCTGFHSEVGEKAVEITQMIKETYGERSCDESTVKRWTKQFYEERTRLEDKAHSGRQSDSITDENIVQIRTLLNDARVPLSELAVCMPLDQCCQVIMRKIRVHV